MKQVKHHFCWAECVSLKATAARDFYTQLFGWTHQDKTMHNGLDYTTFLLQEEPCSALHAMPNELAAQGVPSHWAYFISTPDLEQSLAKARELGAEIVQEAALVEGSGRIGVITDPTGVLLHFWEAGKEKGFGQFPPGQAGAPCWFELISGQPEKAIEFYTALFGWEARAMELPNLNYWLFTQDNIPVAGLLDAPDSCKEIPPTWMIYFNSQNLDADTEKSKALGGQVVEPPQTISVGSFSLLADPAGAVFALLWMDPNFSSSSN